MLCAPATAGALESEALHNATLRPSPEHKYQAGITTRFPFLRLVK